MGELTHKAIESLRPENRQGLLSRIAKSAIEHGGAVAASAGASLDLGAVVAGAVTGGLYGAGKTVAKHIGEYNVLPAEQVARLSGVDMNDPFRGMPGHDTEAREYSVVSAEKLTNLSGSDMQPYTGQAPFVPEQVNYVVHQG